MTVFFLLVGLEIERELYKGELSQPRKALLPIVAAFGGMLVPAFIHFAINRGTPTQAGFGIPVATDIAFALSALSLISKRVPMSLKILLTALAIMDDLGAILVIAVFYTQDLSVLHLMAALLVFSVMIVLNRLNVNCLLCYIAGGILMWLFMLKSGVHPTITGVLFAFAIPFRNGDEHSPSFRMQHFLDKPVPLLILPAFALANTAIIFSPDWFLNLMGRNPLGIVAGLVLGKPLGIVLFALIAVKVRLCRLPQDLNWHHIIGMGLLGGIGFTMSIFIANLAFSEGTTTQDSKIAILCASALAGVAGLLVLRAGRTQNTSSTV